MSVFPSVPQPDWNYNTLQAIQTKVRRLTRSLSQELLTDTDLNNYINTFITYNFPAELRLFSLRTKVTFYTQPGVGEYSAESTNPADPLYNFNNIYMTVHPGVYINGTVGFFTQYPDVFFGNYPQQTQPQDTGLRGNGTSGPFTGFLTINNPFPQNQGQNSNLLLQGSVVFQCLDNSGTAMVIVDYPVSNTTGALGLPRQPQTLPSPYGQIDYQTGAFTLNFPSSTAAGSGNILYGTAFFYTPGLPLAVLYYNNSFVLRPVPDKVYSVTLEADIRPTVLLEQNDVPGLEQWWQWIAYGSALLILQDRMDDESIAKIMPEYKNQMNQVNRTNLVQLTNQRSVTIYTQSKAYQWGWFANSWPF